MRWQLHRAALAPRAKTPFGGRIVGGPHLPSYLLSCVLRYGPALWNLVLSSWTTWSNRKNLIHYHLLPSSTQNLERRLDKVMSLLAADHVSISRETFSSATPKSQIKDVLYHYSAYLQACYPSGHSGKIEFDKFWFPNLKDLWIVKVGEVDRSWMVGVDKDLPCEARLQKTARQFRYWVDEDIIEIASLDLSEPETKMILREGRCGKTDCQQLNLGRQRMVSKVVFVDGKYDGGLSKDEHQRWNRIRPWPTVVEQGATDTDTSANRMRWIIVERILTFSLRWDEPEELDHQDSLDHRRSRRTENTG